MVMEVDWDKFDYDKDHEIHLDSLELDAKNHGKLIMKYAKEQSRIGKMVAQAEEEVKVTRSKIIKKLLEDHKDSKKPTGPEIEAHYRTHPDHIDAKERLINLQYEYNMLTHAVNSFQFGRGDMIKEERALLAMGYFSTVSRTQGKVATIQQREEADTSTRQAVNEKRRRRRK